MKRTRQAPDTMYLIDKECPHCGSTMVYASREYKWKCQKCGRYELNPLEISHPFEAEMYGRQIEVKVMETRVCANPKCGKKFEARITSERELCSKCNAALDTRTRSKKKREAKVGKAA